MNTILNISEILGIQSTLESINLQITSTQSIAALIDLGGNLNAWMAFSGEQMSISKRIWRAETAKAYDSYIFSRMAHGMTIPPSMANKYAEAKSGDHEANYQLCERVNRSITHTIEFLRTVISALKEEQKVYNYQGGAI